MSRAIVQLYDAREVFPSETAALRARAEAMATVNEPRFHAFRDLAGGLTFNTVRSDGGWYVIARRRKTHQLVGYVGNAWDGEDGDGEGGAYDAEDPTWF